MTEEINQGGGSLSSGGGEAAAPPVRTLVTRLFVVPALIVCVLLGVAVVVVLFGSSSIDQPETVADLITRLESDSGERTMSSMLMPKAKDSWQAAQELAQRLTQKDKWIKPAELEPLAVRIAAQLAKYPPGPDSEQADSTQKQFLMLALGRMGAEASVEPLVKLLKDPNGATRRTALQALAEMGRTPKAQAALPAIAATLNDLRPEVQIVACAAIASVAEAGNAEAIRALSSKLEGDREVQWNAAMGLARLGDGRGKMVLMNMLSRGYWEHLELDYLENQAQVRRKLTENEVINNLRAAIDAASHLGDAEIRELIGGLSKDPAVLVRDAAHAAASGATTRKAGLMPGNHGAVGVEQGEVS